MSKKKASDKAIVLETAKLKTTLDVQTMKISLTDKAGGHTWETADDDPHDLGFRVGDDSFETSLASKDHPRKVVRASETSCRVVFPSLNVCVGFALSAGRDDEIIVVLGEAPGGGRAVPAAGAYPRCFRTPVASDAYTVVPKAMGMIIPGDWPERIRATYDADCLEDNEARMAKYADIFRGGKATYWWDTASSLADANVAKFHGSSVLNMFGAVAGDSAYLALVPNRWDWTLGCEHDPGEPTRIRNFWIPTMGRLGYDREVRFRVMPKAGYVEMAKAYREWIDSRGGAKTLEEKAEELPHLRDCIGGCDLGLRFLHHDLRREVYRVGMTFEEGIPAVRDFKKRTGIEKCIVTVRGWQKWGHDHHYPALLPPNSDCGGAPGFAALCDAVRSVGYHFELAGDNYHDIAYLSPDFDPKVCIKNPDGSINHYNMWASGMTSMLALPWAYKYLRRNFELGKLDYPQTVGLLELVGFDYYWIGNWGGLGAEDYNPEYPMDRREHNKWVARLLTYIRGHGKVLDMEHCSEWTMLYLDRCKMRTPGMSKPNQDAEGERIGVPVPLFHLAFNDCVIVRNNGMGWERGMALNGFPRAGAPLGEGFEKSGALERLKTQLAVNEGIGFSALDRHEFLDAERTKERCEYSSGTVVEIDTAGNTFKVDGAKGFKGETQKTPGH